MNPEEVPTLQRQCYRSLLMEGLPCEPTVRAGPDTCSGGRLLGQHPLAHSMAAPTPRSHIPSV